jgi:hypothetical protein
MDIDPEVFGAAATLYQMKTGISRETLYNLFGLPVDKGPKEEVTDTQIIEAQNTYLENNLAVFLSSYIYSTLNTNPETLTEKLDEVTTTLKGGGSRYKQRGGGFFGSLAGLIGRMTAAIANPTKDAIAAIPAKLDAIDGKTALAWVSGAVGFTTTAVGLYTGYTPIANINKILYNIVIGIPQTTLTLCVNGVYLIGEYMAFGALTTTIVGGVFAGAFVVRVVQNYKGKQLTEPGNTDNLKNACMETIAEFKRLGAFALVKIGLKKPEVARLGEDVIAETQRVAVGGQVLNNDDRTGIQTAVNQALIPTQISINYKYKVGIITFSGFDTKTYESALQFAGGKPDRVKLSDGITQAPDPRGGAAAAISSGNGSNASGNGSGNNGSSSPPDVNMGGGRRRRSHKSRRHRRRSAARRPAGRKSRRNSRK